MDATSSPLRAHHAVSARAQRRLDEALTLVDEALSLYREAGEEHGIGRSLLQKAILEESGDLDGAADLLRRSPPKSTASVSRASTTVRAAADSGQK